MADIVNFRRDEDGDPVAELSLGANRTVEIRWASAEGDVTAEELELRDFADKALDGLSEEHLEVIEEEVVRELTDAAFSEDEENPADEEYTKLARDIQLIGVTVFDDGIVTLDFEAPQQYPDSGIYVQLDEHFGVEDLLVE